MVQKYMFCPKNGKNVEKLVQVLDKDSGVQIKEKLVKHVMRNK